MQEVHDKDLAPRLSATMLLVRETPTDTTLQVLANVRSLQLRVLPGFLVFPGGVMECADIHLAKTRYEQYPEPAPDYFQMEQGECNGEIVPKQLLYHALFCTGVRELFEETGIYIGISPLSSQELAQLREELLQGREEAAWNQLFLATASFYPHRYLGRRVTPTDIPYRFDTHYFLVQVPADTIVVPSPGEVEAVFWDTPKELLRGFDRGEFLMVPPTVEALETLDRHSSLQSLFQKAVMPEQSEDDDQMRAVLRQIYSDRL